jgi:hypothetical protein
MKGEDPFHFQAVAVAMPLCLHLAGEMIAIASVDWWDVVAEVSTDGPGRRTSRIQKSSPRPQKQYQSHSAWNHHPQISSLPKALARQRPFDCIHHHDLVL